MRPITKPLLTGLPGCGEPPQHRAGSADLDRPRDQPFRHHQRTAQLDWFSILRRQPLAAGKDTSPVA